MGINFFKGALLATSFLSGFVQANPHFRISARDLYVGETCHDFVVGANSVKFGQVCATLVGGTLTINYKAMTGGYWYKDAHVWVGTTPPTGTVPGRDPGGFTYTVGNGNCVISADKTTTTCTIPVDNGWRSCTGKLYIVTHASIASPTVADGTGWGAGLCWATDNGNCPKYWTVDRTCFCKTTSFPEPITMTSTSTVTFTSTSTTSFLTSTTSTYVTSTTIEYSTTETHTATITSTGTSTTTTTPPPVTLTQTCALAV
ncbi:hypothetical protein BCR34DRAFT_555179 [Clohesyomyces aquaticus]|uniref:Uncharacterized protein n=1 Tax=Clohesyomyces aquaticus TaxID=1231657 RepID=A0A1Y2A5J9_9PLEO|nr:hypothetical protein BCR34DRAFT_555179 [Clohesyomyces aquaticus]